MEIIKPSLTNLTTKFHIRMSLKESRQFKDKYITIAINIILFIVFVTLVIALLYYKYKGKLTPQEKSIKDKQKKQYLFQKLHQISYEKQKENQTLITDLPLI
jgi:lipopolysaccharide export system protein LptC